MKFAPALKCHGRPVFCHSARSSSARWVVNIRMQKSAGTRTRPSARLSDRSALLTTVQRSALLDKVAELVDENLSGRSDMCEQYAVLPALALNHLGIVARAVSGEAVYSNNQGDEIFCWRHAWVRAGAEVIDGNVDSLNENPAAPLAVRVAPYWGPIQTVPRDRRLRESGAQPNPDSDVTNIWWPDLKLWLDKGRKRELRYNRLGD